MLGFGGDSCPRSRKKAAHDIGDRRVPPFELPVNIFVRRANPKPGPRAPRASSARAHRRKGQQASGTIQQRGGTTPNVGSPEALVTGDGPHGPPSDKERRLRRWGCAAPDSESAVSEGSPKSGLSVAQGRAESGSRDSGARGEWHSGGAGRNPSTARLDARSPTSLEVEGPQHSPPLGTCNGSFQATAAGRELEYGAARCTGLRVKGIRMGSGLTAG